MRPLLKDVSIRRKLPLVVMVTSGVALLFACGVFLFYDRATARLALEQDLAALAEVVGTQSAAAVAFDDSRGADEVLSGLGAEHRITSAAVFGKSGRVLALHPRNPGGPGPEPPGRDGLWYDGDYLVVARPILQEGSRIGTFTAKSDLAAISVRLRRGVMVILLILLASSVAALGLSLKLGAMITRPVLRLAETMRTVTSEKNYTLQAAPTGRDEIGRLIEGFNAMLSQIRERDVALENKVREVTEAQQRMAVQQAELGTYHDLVTHDETNFAGTLMIIVEHLLSQREGALRPKQRELLQRANRQIFQLNQLAANAKTLVRLREKGLPPPGASVRLCPLIGRAVETVRSVHFDQPFEVRVDCPAEITIPDIPFLENVFLNLVDNAVRHSAKGVPPRLRILVSQAGPEVRVAVRGGKPADDAVRERLFTRYARGPYSKGAGLGLFVVREIVERAGGRVAAGTAQESEGDVFEVTLSLPRGPLWQES